MQRRNRIITSTVILALIGAGVWIVLAQRNNHTPAAATNQNININVNQGTNPSLDPVEPINGNSNTNQVQVDPYGQYQ